MAEHAEHTDNSVTRDSDEVRQSLAGGVQNPKWFVAVVRRNREEMCRKNLQEQGVEAFVASQKEIHVYPNRHRREVTHLVISGIVFIHISEDQRLPLLRNNPLIQFFLTDKAGQANDFGRHPLAVIPDEQIERLKYMLYHADSPVNFTAPPLRKGDTIRVVRGKLKGLEGNYLRESKNAYIVISIGSLGCAMANVSIGDIERVN